MSEGRAMSAGGARIGIDLGGTKIEVIALAPDGTESLRRRVPTPRGDYDAIVAAVAALVAAAEAEVGPAVSVGVGTPGAPSPATGRMRNCNTERLNGRALREDLAAAIGRPIALANDADCFALSEATDGAGAGAGVVFGVILGTGVGGGIVANGRLLQGPNAIAGEWGHVPLPWPHDHERPGPACYCGRHGCLETFLSGPGLARDHALHGGALGSTAEAIATAAEAGDPVAHGAVQRWLDRLARGLAMVIDVLDPHVVVLGGGLSKLGSVYAELPARLSAHVFSDVVRTRVVPPVHGDSSGVRGAAWLTTDPTPPR